MKPHVAVPAGLLILLFAMTGTVFAQLQEAVVKVDGLACPFCVKGVEKHLKKVNGVEDVSTSLKKGTVRLGYTEDAEFDLERIRTAVVDGGFTPGAVTVTAVGRVARKDDDFVFNVSGAKDTFLLHGPHAEDLPADKTLDDATAAELEEAVESDANVRITGQVHRHAGMPDGLSVESLETEPGGE